MYESHWKLDARPFDHSADARFYYPGPTQQAALLKLRYAVENRRGCALLAGESGLGKTLVAQTLLQQLDEAFQPQVHLVFPQMPAEQLLASLADQLAGGASRPASIEQSLGRIESALLDQFQAGRHPVIVIDEAHLLREVRSLQTIRLLLNLEYQAQPLATFLLIGQTRLALDVQRMPELEERLTVKCLLQRLTEGETAAYIRHRLTAAGARQEIFDREALAAIFERTHGIPRRINRLCDLALLVGFGEELHTISREQVEAIDDELSFAAAAA